MTLGNTDRWSIDPDSNNSYFGVYPHSGSNDVLPDSIELVADVGLGMLHPGVAFALAVDDIAESLSDNNGVSQVSDGWELTHHPSAFEDRWTDCKHFQRFFVEAPQDVIPTAEHLNIKVGCNYGYLGNNATESEYSLIFGQDSADEPSVSTMLAQEDGTIDLNPENMSQETKDRFGIKKIDNTKTSVNDSDTGTGTPKYVAKNFPISANIK
ncbi:hypothetical protein [Haladaptatus cibarius]|uniref:hypothetical protein n=1 Tax=Haladaptatus cibarius TaxID=453847 RepID=UPI0006796E92|nr:hypothetical protein [Haladaptatus cibarius]